MAEKWGVLGFRLGPPCKDARSAYATFGRQQLGGKKKKDGGGGDAKVQELQRWEEYVEKRGKKRLKRVTELGLLNVGSGESWDAVLKSTDI